MTDVERRTGSADVRDAVEALVGSRVFGRDDLARIDDELAGAVCAGRLGAVEPSAADEEGAVVVEHGDRRERDAEGGPRDARHAVELRIADRLGEPEALDGSLAAVLSEFSVDAKHKILPPPTTLRHE